MTPAGSGPLTHPGADLVTGLGYGDVGAFAPLPAGTYAVSVRAAGSPPSTPPAMSARVEVTAGAARTVAVSGRFAALSLEVLDDDLSAPPVGSARVRVLAAAAGAGPLDVALDGGPSLATGLAFPAAAPPVVVPAGTAGVRIGTQPSVPVELTAGSVATLLVLDRPGGGLSVRTVLDAAGPQVVPTGGVEAGTGGTAVPPHALAAVALAAVAAAALVPGRRRGAVAVVLTVAAGGLVGPALPAAHASARLPAGDVGISAVAFVRPAVAEPVRLRVPSAGIDTTLTGIGRDGAGALLPPAEGAGWYREGPGPGSPGPAVLTGHVDGPTGPAAFFGLRRVAVGDPVQVDRADGTTATFTVTRVERYPKSAFPSAEVYGPTPGAELRLITCGGAFDRARGSYVDNLVVFATVT